MTRCPIPWCRRELGPNERHPDHERWAAEMAADPQLEYVAVSEKDLGIVRAKTGEPHPEALNVFRRRRR